MTYALKGEDCVNSIRNVLPFRPLQHMCQWLVLANPSKKWWFLGNGFSLSHRPIQDVDV